MHTNHKCWLSLDIALAAAASVAAVVMLGPYVYGKLSARSLAAKCRRFKTLILTYDDGPGTNLTPMILGILRGHQVRATFFCQGIRASESPDMLDLILSEGHEIGCHTYRHHHSWKVWPHVALCDIERGYASLARWMPSNGIFRPPYGKITLFTWLSLLKRGARLVWWTHDSGDTCPSSLPPFERVVDRIIEAGGGVVLLHDFERKNDSNQSLRHQFVLNVTTSLIERALQSGLTIMTLGELFQLKKAPLTRIRRRG